ncbi:MAG: hypothetical protein ACKO28_04295, partial [Cyanobium sp.]
WTTTHSTANPNPLQSPCVSSQSTRPGSNDGVPTALAVGLRDGNFRNLVNNQVNTGTQRFRLRAVRYTTGPLQGTAAQVQDRRSISRTFSDSSSWNLTSQVGTLPSGANFQDMLNLDDPDGSGSLPAGNNGGFIALTVEGRVYRPDGTFSSFTTTREFEVYAKCCGGAFGGNNTTSLGADRRFCGVEFGMVVGINGGRFFSQASNDRYTMRNTANQVVNLASIVGVVADPTHTWQRGMVGSSTTYPKVGCRTVPGGCNNASITEDRVPGDTTTVSAYAWPFPPVAGANPAASACWPGTVTANYGDLRSIEGRAASCVPFAPIFFSTGLPSIASRYTYPWTTANTMAVSQLAVNSNNWPASYGSATNPDIRYPSFIINGTSATADDQVRIWIRANRSNQLANATGNPSGLTPYLEYCNTKYLPSNNCASVFQGSNIHTWAVISRGDDPNTLGVNEALVATSNPGGIRIGDDFGNAVATAAGFSGYATGSTPRWPSLWQEADQESGGIGINLANGDLYVRPISGVGNVVTFRDVVGLDQGTTLTNWPAIARAVNLHALRAPVLEFSFSRVRGTSAANTAALRLDYSFTNPITTDAAVNTDTGWTSLASVTADGGVRTQVDTTIGTANIGFNTALSNGAVNLSGGSGGLCEATTTGSYSTSNPLYTCRILLPPAATAATNRFSHYVKFRLRANSNLGPATTAANIEEINLRNVQIKSWNTSTSAVEQPTYLNWCEYSSGLPTTANFTGGFHCLGPSIDIRATNASNVSSNRIWMDTTDASITFYYNRQEDTRGIRNFVPAAGANTGVAGPLILLSNGAGIANVMCTGGRGNLETDPLRQTNAPVEN